MTTQRENDPVEPVQDVGGTDSLLIRWSILERLDWDRIFPRSQPVELELGAGDGSFILAYAAARPDTNFLAVERLLGRLRKIDRKGRRAGLGTHLRGIRLEAAYLLEWMIPPASINAIHLYFPDPWPKRKHWKNRIFTDAFMDSAARALVPGGCLHARTDDAPYFAQMETVGAAACARGGWEPMAPSSELLGYRTDFETLFHQQGKPTLSASWRWMAQPTGGEG